MENEDVKIKTCKEYLEGLNKKRQVVIGICMLIIGLVIPWTPVNWMMFSVGAFQVIFFSALKRVDNKKRGL